VEDLTFIKIERGATLEQFEVIRIYDPAIDARASSQGVLKFSVDRDPKHLTFHPGKKPVKFKARRFNHHEFLTWVDLANTENEKFIRSFQVCVDSVVDWPSEGKSWMPAARSPGQSTILSPDEIGVFHITDLIEVGAVCYQRSMLPLDYAPRFVLPHTSARVWAAKEQASPSSPAEPTQVSAQ